MITRKIGKFLRGKATPFQIISASVLGALIGFVPGFMHAPALVIGLLVVLLVLNANLGIAAIVTVLAKLLALVVQPISFQVGRVLIDGPTEPLFRWMINTPVLAWAGMDSYVTVGGVVLGLVLGVAIGVAFVRTLQAFRRKMGLLEEGSERYQKFTGRKSVKIATFLLVGGGRGKKSWDQLASRGVGNPVRVVGVVLAVLLVGLVGVMQYALGDKIMTGILQSRLEQANGATIELETAELDFRAGRLTLGGLAMADPNALDTDLLRATEVQADISSTDLLTRRITFDRIALRDASSGEQRARPGVLVGGKPKPQPAPGEGKTIDDYVKDAEKWKGRLAKLREWLETAEGRPGGDEDSPAEDRETLKERLQRQARELGYANVRATHLVEDAPELLIRELVIDGLTIKSLESEVLDVLGAALSTQPSLGKRAPEVRVTSRSGRLEASASLGRFVPSSGVTRVSFRLDGIPGDAIGRALAVAGTEPVKGGTVDVHLDGEVTGAGIDFPLAVTLHGSTLQIPGVGETVVETLVLPIGLRGPLDNPSISLENDALAKALAEAGKAEAAKRLQGEADKLLDEQLGEGDLADKARGALGGLLGGGEKDDD
jgi:uncharacterized protein (TIGR03546 family)